MMRKVQRLVWSMGAAATVLALTSGCASIKDHRGYLGDRVLMDAVTPGIDNRQSVERTLGRPTFVSEFGRKDWYYVSVMTRSAPFKRPKTYDETIMRVRFDGDGNVAGIDKRGKEDVARIDPYGNITPTLGKKRSVLEDLFGNIGAVGAGGGGPVGGQGGPGGGPGSGPNGS
jgi:outer membrane protein assembly factor BamE (lipoprotein component of BamABCDE complex)